MTLAKDPGFNLWRSGRQISGNDTLSGWATNWLIKAPRTDLRLSGCHRYISLTRLLLCDLESEPFYGVEVTPSLGVASVHDHPQHSARAQTVHQEARSPRALVGAQPLARQVVHLQVEDLRLTAVEPLLAVDLQGLGRLVGHRAVQRGVRVPCNQFTDFILWLNYTRLRSSGTGLITIFV